MTQKVTNWNMVWGIATLASAVLLGMFCFLFRDDITERKAVPSTDEKWKA
jgi:hypothetical protein